MRKYVYGFEAPPSKFHIQCEEVSKKSEAGEPQCWVWTWPGSFASHPRLLLDALFLQSPLVQTTEWAASLSSVLICR